MTDYLPGNAAQARAFLAKFWQKKPLFARAALPDYAHALDRARMLELACRDDVESRLVTGAGTSWRVERGPFRKRDLLRLPPREWTLLINGLESVLPAARALQQAFNFIPYARHDDVMASYAAPGGSVGPHFDSFDVFLVQGVGERRWQVGAQRNLDLIPDAPLKILRRFRPQRECTAQAGDVLYLPPRYAHHGVALGECVTWSVGFRAPGKREFTERFLDFLRDQARADETYRDPQLRPQQRPAAIGADMLRKIKSIVDSISWTDADIERCLGEYLTEPHAGVVFRRARRVSAQRFAELSHARGVRLALPTRMLTSGAQIFVNSETTRIAAASAPVLHRLADERSLPARTRTDAATRALLYQWYRSGFIELADKSK